MRNRHGDDLITQASGRNCRGGPRVALFCHTILFVTRDIARGISLGAEAHQAGIKRTPQTVFDDRIGKFGVAIAKTTARTGGEIWRVGHRLHACRNDDVGVTTGNHLVSEIDRVQSRQTHLVHVHARHAQRNARLDRCLT